MSNNNNKTSKLRNLQDLLQKKLGFSLPLFQGRGIFNYDFGLLPHRRPITTVVVRKRTHKRSREELRLTPPPLFSSNAASGAGQAA